MCHTRTRIPKTNARTFTYKYLYARTHIHAVYIIKHTHLRAYWFFWGRQGKSVTPALRIKNKEFIVLPARNTVTKFMKPCGGCRCRPPPHPLPPYGCALTHHSHSLLLYPREWREGVLEHYAALRGFCTRNFRRLKLN